MAHAYSHFSAVSRSPKPTGLSSLFRGSRTGSEETSSLSRQLQDIVSQLSQQSSALSGLAKSLPGGTGLQGLFGGGIAGGLLDSAQSGFSFESILKKVFPLGGLISGIAGLFHSAPTPPPLNEYDAPPQLNFNAVLGKDGSVSQGSGNQYGYTRSSSSGLDLIDAAGGPYSPYQRVANGSFAAIAGDPTTRYGGTLNLTGTGSSNVSSPVGNLGQLNPSELNPLALNSSGASIPSLLQSLVGTGEAGTPASPTTSTTGNMGSPAAANSLLQSGSANGFPASASQPSFDKQWFDDHGSLIASAVRNQLLNFHPIVDAINDL